MKINAILNEIVHLSRAQLDFQDRMSLLAIRLGQLADENYDDGTGGLEQLIGKVLGKTREAATALELERARADELERQLRLAETHRDEYMQQIADAREEMRRITEKLY